jgi:chromosome segregation ATPase
LHLQQVIVIENLGSVGEMVPRAALLDAELASAKAMPGKGSRELIGEAPSLSIHQSDLEETRGRVDAEVLAETSKKRRKELEELLSTRDREASFEMDLTEWTQHATSSQERANELFEVLNHCAIELDTTRTRESDLEAALAELEREVRVAQNDEVERLSQQLAKCAFDLKDNQRALEESQVRELTFRDDLADMTVRAEDSEAVSKLRMQLVQSTRAKLAVAQLQAEGLEKREEQLVSDVNIWTEKTFDVEKLVESLENDLKETRETIEDNQEVLASSQLEVAKRKSKDAKLVSDLESWIDTASVADTLSECLQQELVHAGDLLKGSQHAQRTVHVGEETLKQQVPTLEDITLHLKEGLEVAFKARQEVIDEAEEKLQSIRADLSTKAEDAIESVRSKLTARLDEEIQTSIKYKQDLFHAQETLNETQGSLGASQDRERMLKLERTKYEEALEELEVALEDARKKKNRCFAEPSRREGRERGTHRRQAAKDRCTGGVIGCR